MEECYFSVDCVKLTRPGGSLKLASQQKNGAKNAPNRRESASPFGLFFLCAVLRRTVY
jgi:hypothetical protein